MADRYWVTGGNGVWTSTGNWSATSGGSSGASVPTNSDNAFFDQVATYTVTGNATALNLLVSAGTVTFTLGVNGFGGTAATYFTFNSGTVAGFSASSATTFSTTTTLVINTNGVALTGAGYVIFGTSTRTGTVSLGGDFAITGAISSAKVTLAYGTLDLVSFKLTSEGQFATANAVTHTLAFGTGNITVTGANVANIAWDTGGGTNNVTGTPTVNISYNVAGSLTVATQITGTEANSISFNFTTGTYTLTFLNTAGCVARSVSFAGFGGTWAARTTSNTIYGDLTLSAVAGFSVAASTGTLTFGSTSATTRTITSNAKTFDGPVTISGVGGTFQLADAMTLGATRTLTLTNGTLNLNNQLLTAGLFSSSNSNTRTIAFGSTGSIKLNAAGGTLWTTATNTNFAYTGTSNVTIDNSGAVATTLTPGTLTEAQALNFNIISGTYTLTLTNTPAFKNLNFVNTGTTGFAGTLPARTVDTIIYGNLTISSNIFSLAASTSGFIFRATSGTQILTSNTITFDMPMAQNGVGGTLQLADALTMGSTRTFNFNNGTFDGNSKTMTGATALSASAGGVTAFKRMNTSIVFNHTSSTMTMVGDNTTGKISTISGSIDLGGYVWTATGFGTNVGTKSLTFNGGTLSLTGPYAPTFDNFNPTGFTTVAGTGTGYIRMTASAAKTFFGNGSTFNCILSNDGAGALTIQNSNTFLGITNGVSPSAFIFTAGTTQTMGSWTVSGTAGNLVTITSTTAGTAASLVKTGGGTVSANYLSLKDSSVTPNTLTWYAGGNSTNVSGNSGWIFTIPPVSISVSVTGVSATSSVGTPTTTSETPAATTGVASTTSVGSVAVAINATVNVTGQAATSAVGTAVARSDATVAFDGWNRALGWGIGPFGSEAATIGLATGAVGTPTILINASVSVTGLSSTTSVGTVTALSSTVVPVTGVVATGSVGTATTTLSSNVSVTGLSSTGSVGTATVQASSNVSVTGRSATGSVGTVTASVSPFVNVTGQYATGLVGTAVGSVSATANVTGRSATGSVGSVTIDFTIYAPVTGVASTTRVGTPTVRVDCAIPVTGVYAAGSVGAALARIDITINPTGYVATGSVGQVLAAINATVNLAGVYATGYVGQALVWGQIIPGQTPAWAEIDPTQSASWTQITPSQTPVWTEISA